MGNYHEPFSVEKMSKKVMEISLVFVLLLVFSLAVVVAEDDSDDWGDFIVIEEDYVDEDVPINEDVAPTVPNDIVEDPVDPVENVSGITDNRGTFANDYGEVHAYNEGEEIPSKFKTEFWVLIGVGAVVLLIILYLVYSFFVSPSNRWKK